MEPEIRAFLARIVLTISLVILWMFMNTFFGIKMGYMFLEGKITLGHILYYIFLLGGSTWLFIFLWRKWKKAPTYNRELDEWIYPD